MTEPVATTVTVPTSSAGGTAPTVAAVRPLSRPTPNRLASAAQLAGLFDAASNWLNSLPTNPMTQLVQGALLLVRRALFQEPTPVNPGPTDGQTDPTQPTFTQQQLQAYLLNLAKQQYGGQFGQTIPVYNYGYYYMRDSLGGVGGAAPSAGGGITSGTNTQEEGVDEADFVETDGTNLYVTRNGRLTILDRDLNVTSQVDLSGNVVGSFLSGDRLTVITQTGYGWYGPGIIADFAPYPPYGQWNPKTTVTVYDVSDVATPAVTSQTMFDGSFRDARAVDGTVYVVMDTQFKIPPPLYTETPVDPEVPVEDPTLLTAGDIAAKPAYWWNPTVVSNRTYETWDDYVARVGDQIVNLSVPHYYSVDAEGNSVDLGQLVEAADIVRPNTDSQSALVTLVSVDSAGAGFADSVGRVVQNSGNAIYMSGNALYVATTEGNYSDTGSSTDTRIDRFAINGTEIGWQASGLVSGTLINQFAMDEEDGYLRVATHTTASQWIANSPSAGEPRGYWQNRNDNGVYVLDTEGDVLDLVSSLTGLAPGEHLYAARFVDDKAYLVTFLQTDPLFVIDLSDEKTPTLLGELVIPGFSNYLQPVGDGLLLGIGQERPVGTWNTHLHASLFDVSDGTAPTQIDRQFLDESSQWSWSEAQYDHHAVLYSAEDGLLVLPVYGNGYDQQTGQYRYEQFLSVLHVDASGITVLGEIHSDESVIRTMRIGDVLYAVSDNSVTAYSLTDFSKLGTANLAGVITA